MLRPVSRWSGNVARTLCLLLALAGLAAIGCGQEEASQHSLGIDSQDHRFALELSAERAAGALDLRLGVEPRPGWKLVPESPARLDAEAPAGYRVEPEKQRSEDALEYSEKRLEFGLRLQGIAADGEPAQDAAAVAQLKFGVCRSDSSHCEVVRERLALPVRELLATAG